MSRKERTGERNAKIIEAYNNLLKEEGSKAPLLPKAYFYDRLADMFFLSSERISRIINAPLRERR